EPLRIPDGDVAGWRPWRVRDGLEARLLVRRLLLGLDGRTVRTRRDEHPLDGRRRRADHPREGPAVAARRRLVDDPATACARRRRSSRARLRPRLRRPERRHGRDIGASRARSGARHMKVREVWFQPSSGRWGWPGRVLLVDGPGPPPDYVGRVRDERAVTFLGRSDEWRSLAKAIAARCAAPL